ncbi:MAG: hypothetical protein HQL48_02405, partial [Gammaproteobacteria bacterium]|nr:hypothetical protein [Gammaproteobacteria bacterium]
MIDDNELFSEDGFIIFTMKDGGYILSQEITAYQREDQLYYSFIPFVESLGLGANTITNESTGFITLSYEFSDTDLQVNPKNNQVIKNGVITENEALSIVLFQGEVLVEKSILEKIMELTLLEDYQNLLIELKTVKKYPALEKIRRLEREINQSKGLTSVLPLKPTPYRFITSPAVDARFYYTYRDNTRNSGDEDRRYRYSFKLVNELFYLTNSILMSGNNNNSLSSMNINLSRTDHDSQLLGPLSATRIQLGDLSVSGSLYPAASIHERGVMIENTNFLRQVYDENISLSGSIMSDWDVELYVNGVLTRYQTSDDTQRYTFDNVPLFFGTNKVILRFYGPEGQQY